MPAQNYQIESIGLDGCRLIARMHFKVDRFVTELYLGSENDIDLVLQSEEGTNQNTWPPSGPLQEILPHQDGDKKCLAGVGRAGKSHWSTVLSTVSPKTGGSESNAETSAYVPCIDFDFACRAKESPNFLGSTYRLNTDLVALQPLDGSGSAILRIRDRLIRCQPSRGKVGQDDKIGRIEISAEPTAAELPQTVRWQYQFQLV